MILRLHDLLFLVGLSLALAGAWSIGWKIGLIGSGLAVALAGVIVRMITLRNQKGRRR